MSFNDVIIFGKTFLFSEFVCVSFLGASGPIKGLYFSHVNGQDRTVQCGTAQALLTYVDMAKSRFIYVQSLPNKVLIYDRHLKWLRKS